MKPVKTETTNVTYVGQGCVDLPGASYLCDDGITPGIETVWELDEKEQEQIAASGRIYLYVMGRTVQPCFIAAESVIKIERDGGEDENNK